MSAPDLVLRTTLGVLEDFAFLFAEPASDPAEWPSDPLSVTIPFTGQHCGSLTLTVERELMGDVARDLLGAGPGAPPTPGDEEATLSELSNVLLGVLLERAFGAANACQVGLPEVGAGPESGHGAAVDAVTLCDPMGRPLRVEFRTALAQATCSS